jgi:uncharacterized membrane protein YcjF (UPF0283 family)
MTLAITEFIPIVLYVGIFAIVSYFISNLLAKKKKILLLLIPGITLALALLMIVFAFLTNDWGALGYLILGAIAVASFVGSVIASLILYFTKFKKKD